MTPEHEATIIGCLSDGHTLIRLIARDLAKQESYYFLRCFFIELRQLAYYFSEESSPLIHLRQSLSEKEQSLIKSIADIRHASAHPESSLHWVNKNLRITGSGIFKNNDCYIQFGLISVSLLEAVGLFVKFRDLLGAVPDLRLTDNPSWELDNRSIVEAVEHLSERLRHPEDIIRERMQN